MARWKLRPHSAGRIWTLSSIKEAPVTGILQNNRLAGRTLPAQTATSWHQLLP